jgi:predicted DNA-binding transcriptional regulator AlpA
MKDEDAVPRRRGLPGFGATKPLIIPEKRLDLAVQPRRLPPVQPERPKVIPPTSTIRPPVSALRPTPRPTLGPVTAAAASAAIRHGAYRQVQVPPSGPAGAALRPPGPSGPLPTPGPAPVPTVTGGGAKPSPDVPCLGEENEAVEGNVLICPEELAKELGTSPKTLANWRSQGTGPHFVKLGPGHRARVRYQRSAVRKWLAQTSRRKTLEIGSDD